MPETLRLQCQECGKIWKCNVVKNPDGECPACGSCDYDIAPIK
jgi:rRNA maturation endonuclease Nob1